MDVLAVPVGSAWAPKTVEPPQVMLLCVKLLNIVSAGLGRFRPGGDEELEAIPVKVLGRLEVIAVVMAELDRRKDWVFGDVDRLWVWSSSGRWSFIERCGGVSPVE